MWMVYYFIGSMVAALISLEIVRAITAPFFMVKSRFGSKRRSSSESVRRLGR